MARPGLRRLLLAPGRLCLLLLIVSALPAADEDDDPDLRRGRWGDLKIVDLERCLPLHVPADLRHQDVDLRSLTAAVASRHGRTVFPAADGRGAILFDDVYADEVAALATDLSSTEVQTRREAAGRAGWVRDPKTITLLLVAARDVDPDTATLARISLRRLGWDAVWLIDPAAIDLAVIDGRPETHPLAGADPAGLVRHLDLLVNSAWVDDRTHCFNTVQALGQAGATRSLFPLLVHRDPVVRQAAIHALRRSADPAAVEALARILEQASSSESDRSAAFVGLCQALPPERRQTVWTTLTSDPHASRQRLWARLSSLEGDDGDWSLRILLTAAASSDRPQAWNAAGSLGSRLLRTRSVIPLTDLPAGAESLIWRLADLPAGADLVLEAARAAEPRRRQAACYALGQRGDAVALNLLSTLVHDTDPSVQEAACVALGEHGGDEALVLIERLLRDPKTTVRQRSGIYRNLPRFGGETTARFLTPVFDRKGTSEDELLAAIPPLTRLESRRAAPLILACLRSRHRAVRVAAVPLLPRLPWLAAAPWWLSALADTQPKARSEALQHLAKVDLPAALALVVKAAGDPDAHVRRAAIKALGTMTGGSRHRDLIVAAGNDPDLRVRQAAFLALGRLRSPPATNLLLAETWLEHPDPEIRSTVAQALGLRETPETTLALLRLADDTQVEVRQAALRATACHLGTSAQALLVGRLEAPDPDRRLETVTALAGQDRSFDLLHQRWGSETDERVHAAIVAAIGPRTP